MSEAREPIDRIDDGEIVNPELKVNPDANDEGNGVGDRVDVANDLRFSEEEQLIEEQD